MTEQPATIEPAADVTRPSVGAILRAYVRIYERRRLANPRGELFLNTQANAMAALALVKLSVAGASPLPKREAIQPLVALTRRILVEEGHTAASDMAGVAWVEAYGVLAIHHPPLEQIEVVLESGNASRAIAGVYSSAWRALFLATAAPLFNWRYRPLAQRQLTRWIDYVTPKASALAAEGAGPIGASQAARIAYVLAALGARLHSDDLQHAATSIAAQAIAAQRADGSIEGEAPETATAVAAQVVAAARAVGDAGGVNCGLKYLLGPCLAPTQKLLWAVEAEERIAMSPWVPLALLGAERDVS